MRGVTQFSSIDRNKIWESLIFCQKIYRSKGLVGLISNGSEGWTLTV